MRESQPDITIYDNTDVFKNEIQQKLDELMILCSQYQIPMFITFAVKNTVNDTEYYNDQISCANADVTLTNNLIPKLVDVMNGFDVIPFFDPRTVDLDIHSAKAVSDEVDNEFSLTEDCPPGYEECQNPSSDSDNSRNNSGTNSNTGEG